MASTNYTTATAWSMHDECDFKRMYNRYKGMIERYAFYLTRSRQDVEDMAQEVFLKLCMNWGKVKQLTDSELEDFIYVITRNYIFNLCKKLSHVRKKSLLLRKNLKDSCVHDEIIFREGLFIYQEAIRLLPEKQRRVYLFREIEQSRQTIAKTLNISEHTVNNHLNSAFKTVRGHLNRKFHVNIDIDARKKIWNCVA